MNIKTLAKKYDLEKIDKKLGDNFWKPLDIAKINDWVLRAVVLLLEPEKVNTKGD